MMTLRMKMVQRCKTKVVGKINENEIQGMDFDKRRQ